MMTFRAGYRVGQGATRGFTLIELLTVIAIIAILMSLVVPALRSARGKGAEAKCIMNVRQLIVARRLYAADHFGNMIPNRPVWPDDPKGWATWRWVLQAQYGTSKDLFLCPSAPNAYSEAGRGEGFATAKSDLPANYTQIGEVFGNDDKSRRLSIISSPTTQLELIEFRDYWPDMNMGSWGWTWADGYGVFGFWHEGKATAGYVDGHVAVLKLSETVTPHCQWDTPAGPHDGRLHPEYNYMLTHYK